MESQEFTITGLTCDACVKMSALTLKKIAGVTSVSIDLRTGAARVESAVPIDPNAIRERLAAKGYVAVMK